MGSEQNENGTRVAWGMGTATSTGPAGLNHTNSTLFLFWPLSLFFPENQLSNYLVVLLVQRFHCYESYTLLQMTEWCARTGVSPRPR
jgi:hypothetical protein